MKNITVFVNESLNGATFKKLSKTIEKLINQYKDHIDDYDISFEDNNQIVVKISKNRHEDYEKYTDSEIFKFRSTKDNLYTYTVTSISGTKGVSHTKGYGYGLHSDSFIIKEDKILKVIENNIKEQIKWSHW